MMIVLDKNQKFSRVIESYKNLKILIEDATYNTISFFVPIDDYILEEENIIECGGQWYKVKEINFNKKGLYEVYCKPYLGALESKTIENISGYDMTLTAVMEQIVLDTGWTWIDSKETGVYSLSIKEKTAKEAIDLVSKVYHLDFSFDTKARTIKVNHKQGIQHSLVINRDSLKNIEIESDTYDLCTRLIPIGKDGLTIAGIYGKPYVENYQYTTDIITKYKKYNNIKNVDDLFETASAEMSKLSRPKTSYKIPLYLLNAEVDIRDNILIINSLNNRKTIEEIVKIVLYPNYPEKSYMEVGSKANMFDDMFKDFKDIQSIVNDETLTNLTQLNKYYL